MNNDQFPYRSYLLRLWATEHNGHVIWRASLEYPHTGDRLGFSTLERMFAFLQDQCRESHERACPPPAMRDE